MIQLLRHKQLYFMKCWIFFFQGRVILRLFQALRDLVTLESITLPFRNLLHQLSFVIRAYFIQNRRTESLDCPQTRQFFFSVSEARSFLLQERYVIWWSSFQGIIIGFCLSEWINFHETAWVNPESLDTFRWIESSDFGSRSWPFPVSRSVTAVSMLPVVDHDPELGVCWHLYRIMFYEFCL